ncbi:NlpC/P60 family putative phage cell wall peptidase [Albidovulum inexpectatum]|uniref:NlpC/P60 family putative phage cell wall peptidase n=1 Tax=Albidovulum inexpectatum TaxID=196587 RepID=A0A2S5JE09_9RHOB|nr:NlpC/P60 family protein [Albidovulum inexpectatum]PPB79752.1 NlpC/P60 family putative phage cell wall peptidase [Albidovulum inexpectatum]
MVGADPDRVISAARAWLGTPYHDQASLRGVGCDCLGLVRGVWREVVGPEPAGLPPYSADWGEVGRREYVLRECRARMIEVAKPQPGCVLVFRMVPGAVAKHLGVLTRDGTFVHAYERTGVIEEPFTRAWARRVAAQFLLPAGEVH